MNFFGKLFNPQEVESIVLIDISAASVAGAYAVYKKGEAPTLLYSRRLPIEIRSDEPHENAMIRALGVLGNELIREGAPALARETGSGRAETILVSVDAPWQETQVRAEHFERKTPFVFTKKMVATALEKTSAPQPGKHLADESIIGTILNGYETNEPYGKKVQRASVITLTSFIDEKVSKSITETLSGLFHTKDILSIAGSSLRYQAIRVAFPHESNALILDALGSVISIALVRHNLLVAVSEISEGVSTKDIPAWLEKVMGELTKLAERYPLPRTIFLMSQESDIADLEKALATSTLSSLWLSDNPPKVVSVLANHIVGNVRQAAQALPDLPLLLMALHWKHKPSE